MPTPDHFLPMLYLAGLAGSSPSAAQVLVDGYAYGSLSMTSYTLDAPPMPTPSDVPAAGDAPDVPADESNI